MSKTGSPNICDPLSAKSAEPLFNGIAHPGGSAAIRILREPTSLLSLVDSDPIVSGMIDHAVLETLIRISDDGTSVIPELAEHFEVDESRHQYTFHLAENATWHDGRPVTSTDVKFVFGKLTDPFNPFPLTGIFTNIADIDTPDEDTVVFTLDKRIPEFLEAAATVPILPFHVFGRTPLSLHEASRAPVGSGPYRFVRWIPSQLIELERNPEWRGTPPYLDEIRYVIVPDNRIAVDMFAHGDLDIIWDFPTGAATPKEDARIISFPLPFLETWLFNSDSAFFKEAAVRRAMDMLVDRKTICSAVLQCHADLPDAPPLASRADGVIFKTLPFDPKAAGTLLDNTGFHDRDRNGIRKKGGMRLSFSLLVPNLGRDVERAAVLIQEDLAHAGIDMRIVIVSRGAFMGRLGAGRFEAAAAPLPLGAVDSPFSFFHSEYGSVARFGGAADPGIDALIEELRAEFSVEKQQATRREIAARIVDIHPAFFLYRSHGAALVRSSIHGIRIQEGWIDVTALFRDRGDG